MTPDDTRGRIEVPGEVPAETRRSRSARSGTRSASKKGTRRTRSPHPGVVLIPPDPEHGHPTWRARFTDPDTGRSTKTRLDPLVLSTAEARRDWAIKKAKAIARRRMDLESGAPRATGTAFDVAIDRYFEDHPRLRERTLDIYKRSAGKLKAWASRAGVKSADELTLARLVAFRSALVKQPKRSRAKGERRGKTLDSSALRAPGAVNIDLRSVRTVLGYLRRLGLLPRLTSDDLTDGLAKLDTDHERGHVLKSTELARLFEATLAHDAATFTATREEHADAESRASLRRGERGATRRYEPISPLVMAAVLTGMRIGEIVSLEWSQIDLDAPGEDGQPVGEIQLTARTKTKRARTVDLGVSPALRELLTRMRPNPASGLVFGLTFDQVKAAVRRLDEFGAPEGWAWNPLRRTCGTFLTCAPGIFGAASAYRSARQLGHSVTVAEKHYVGVIRGIPREVRTLEAAMQIEGHAQRVIESASGTT